MVITQAPPADNLARVENARKLLQQGQAGGAAALCRAVLSDDPADKDALYTLAVACRIIRDFDAALQHIEHLIEIDPANGRAHQERGHCLRDMGRRDDAFSAYQSAVAHNAAEIQRVFIQHGLAELSLN